MLALAGVATWAVWVSAPTDCPDPGQVVAALSDLVPEAAVTAGPAPATDPRPQRLRVDVAAVDDQLQLTVTDGRDAVVLARTLPARGTCAERADAIALVVERFVHDLGWAPGDVAVDAPGPPPSPPPARDRWRLAVDARATVALVGVQAGAAASLDLRRGSLGPAVELGATWPRGEEIMRTGGAVAGEVELSTLHLAAGARLRRGPLVATALVGGERLTARAVGDLFQRTDQAGWQVVGRADVGVDRRLGRRLGLRATAGLEVRPAPTEIAVEGASATVASPRLRAVLALGLTWQLR